MVMSGSNRPSWAPITRGYQKVPGLPGAHLLKKPQVEPRPLPIPVYIKSIDMNVLQKHKEDLARWLIHDEPKPLIFDDELDRTYYAVIDGKFDIDEFIRAGRGVLPFICPDPYKYGFEYNWDVVSGQSLEYYGSAPTAPIFTVTFTQQMSEFEIKSGPNNVRVIFNFKTFDTLTIDLSKRKILLNGKHTQHIYDWKSKPFDLVPGMNNLTFSAGAKVKINFRERWL